MIAESMLTQFENFLREQQGFAKATIDAYISDISVGLRESNGAALNFEKYTEFEAFLMGLKIATEYSTGKPKKRWSNLTAYGFISSWSVFYSWAYKRGFCPHNPLKDGHDFKKGEGKMPEFFDWDSLEFKKILNYPNNSVRFMAMLHVLRSSGVRAAELCNLKIDDVKDSWLVIKEGKGGKYRTALVDEEARLWLNQYIKGLGMVYTGQWLFPREDWRGPIKPGSLWKQLNRLGTKLGIKIYPHKFRHSVGAEWLKRGGDIVTLADQLGHADIKTTKIYTHLTPKQREAEFKKLFG